VIAPRRQCGVIIMAAILDDRGRWQADPSARIAQTASQLRGLVDAGVGDPFQFAGPNERVPLAAVRYWEDTIAAQGPVINGRAKLELGDDGRMFLNIEPSDGSPTIKVEVEGTPVIASGFPPERIPGTPRNMTPEKALGDVKKVLDGILADPATPRELKTRVQAAQRELEPLSGVRQGRTSREQDLAKARKILGRYGLERAVHDGSGDAHQMLLAGEKWYQMRSAAPGRVFLGDEANLTSLDPKATNDWVIAGTGGTGVSAAEIILAGNPAARVSMVGRDAPAGLLEHDQFQALLKAHADPQTVAAIASAGGPPIDASGSDGRLSVVFGVDLAAPTRTNRTYRAAAGTPDGYDPRRNNPFVGGGYVAAIGREGQLPPMVAEMVAAAKRKGLLQEALPLFDADDQYIGYRVRILDARGNTVQSMDVTGAASRFMPWEMLPQGISDPVRAEMRAKVEAASDLDAPPESGNFDGGFVSSATQAARYGRHRRKPSGP